MVGPDLGGLFQPQWFCEMTCGVLHQHAGAVRAGTLVLVAQGGSGAGLGSFLGTGALGLLGGCRACSLF